MKVGDLIKLQREIHHALGFYRAGMIGIVMKIQGKSGKIVLVGFGNKRIDCHWDELKVINESR